MSRSIPSAARRDPRRVPSREHERVADRHHPLATKPASKRRPSDSTARRSSCVPTTELGHRIYALETPLHPGESLRLDFEVRFKPRGFPNSGIDASVVANGTYFTNAAVAARRRLSGGARTSEAPANDARTASPRARAPLLDDVEARRDTATGRADRVRGDRRHGRRAGRSRAREAAPDVDGERAPLLSLRDRRADPEGLRLLLRRLRGARRRGGTTSSIQICSSPGSRVERGPHGPKRTGVARLLHAAVRPVSARADQARRAPRRRRWSCTPLR